MKAADFCFWFALGCVTYTYLLYPAIIAGIAAIRPRAVRRGLFPGAVSIVIAAKDEEASIGKRVESLQECLTGRGFPGELIVVSDGSSDQTAAVARVTGGPLVRVLELSDTRGKAAALNEGCAAATGDVVVFADTRQRWASNSLELLVENFTDPAVGAVSGHLEIERSPGVLAGVGLYWRFERWLRAAESRTGSVVGATGAISAVRRHLFRPIPPGTLLDDVYWPLCVAMQGFRVIHDQRALAFDRLPDKPRDEFRRKVRTLSGNFQLVARLPSVLLPWRNPLWAQFISHKLMRLAAPWALLVMIVSSLLGHGLILRAALIAQIGFYSMALLGATRVGGARSKIASAAASFLVLNAAAWVAFWVTVSGRSAKSWSKTVYRATPVGQLPAIP